MRVLLIYPSWPGRAVGNVDPNSLQGYVAQQAATLSQHGHEVSVQQLHHDPIQRMGSTLRELDQRLSDDRPDLVHAHLWTSGFAALAAIRQASKPADMPIVETFHALDTAYSESPSQAHKWRRLEAAVARSVDQLAASSKREQADLISLGASRHVVPVIPHAVDTDVFKPDGDRPSSTSRTRLVAAGPMAPESGFDIAVQALAGLPDAELVIAGSAPAGDESVSALVADNEKKRLMEIAAHIDVTDRVRLITMPTHERLPELLRSAEIVVSTPWRSSPSTPAIEAMACGRPVVAAGVGELLDVVIEGTTGVLVPPRSPRALARAVRDLLDDPLRLEGFGLAAAERARAWHSWERVGDALIDTYNRALA